MFLQKNDPTSPPLEFGAVSKEDLLKIGTDSMCYYKVGPGGMVRVYSANGVLIDEESSVDDAKHEMRGKNLICVTLQ